MTLLGPSILGPSVHMVQEVSCSPVPGLSLPRPSVRGPSLPGPSVAGLTLPGPSVPGTTLPGPSDA